jgi:hypothetical protein
MILWSPHQPGGGCFYNGHPKAKDALKVCPTPDPCLVVEGQRHTRFPGVPRTKSSILLTIRIHQIRWRVTGIPTTPDPWLVVEGQRHTRFPGVPRTKSSILLTIRIWRVTGIPTTLDAFNAIPRQLLRSYYQLFLFSTHDVPRARSRHAAVFIIIIIASCSLYISSAVRPSERRAVAYLYLLLHQWAPKTLKNSTLNTLFLIFWKTLKIAIFKNCFAIFKGVF